MVDIYLIHTADDAARVAPLISQIQDESLSLEVKAAGRRGGLFSRIGSETMDAHCILVVITRSADQSSAFLDSWNSAEKSGRTLFVIVLEESPGLKARYGRGLVITAQKFPALLQFIRGTLPAASHEQPAPRQEQEKKQTRGGLFEEKSATKDALDDLLQIDSLRGGGPPKEDKPEPEPQRRTRSFQPGGAGAQKGEIERASAKRDTSTGKEAKPSEPPPPPPQAPAPAPLPAKPVTTPPQPQPIPAARPAAVTPPSGAASGPAPDAGDAFASDDEAPAPESEAPVREALAAVEETPAAEEVRFTGFSPAKAQVRQWYSLLVYSHVEAALEQVRQDADRFKPYMGGTVREARKSPVAQLQRGTELTLIPQCTGVKFNPERIVFNWLEDIHRADFRFRGENDDLELENINVSVYTGPVNLASLKLGVEFTLDELVSAMESVPQHPMGAEIYTASQIFPSYSHDDEPIVIACRNAYKALGYEFLRDRDKLRPGEPWNDRLMTFIDQANIFQLYWSARSAKSEYCRQEWQHALGLIQSGRKPADFIRPVYWDRDAFVNPPPELGNLHFAYVELPRLNS
ncbi:MAG: toll/interleukin-1 receptor domain-containing protein [Anaerolineae bacterium]|nr:toll/interleukin-1 receptor domain-containing protein [Anaerolineae bacterium]